MEARDYEWTKFEDVKRDDPEVFLKDGSLRKRAPKRWRCKNCAHESGKSGTMRFPGMSFHVCQKCGGSIRETEAYKKWMVVKLNRHLL